MRRFKFRQLRVQLQQDCTGFASQIRNNKPKIRIKIWIIWAVFKLFQISVSTQSSGGSEQREETDTNTTRLNTPRQQNLTKYSKSAHFRGKFLLFLWHSLILEQQITTRQKKMCSSCAEIIQTRSWSASQKHGDRKRRVLAAGTPQRNKAAKLWVMLQKIMKRIFLDFCSCLSLMQDKYRGSGYHLKLVANTTGRNKLICSSKTKNKPTMESLCEIILAHTEAASAHTHISAVTTAASEWC